MKPQIKKAYQDSGLPLFDIPGRDVNKEVEQICAAAEDADEVAELLRAQLARLPQLMTNKIQEVLTTIKSLSTHEQYVLVLALCEAKIAFVGELLDAYLVKSRFLPGASLARLVLESALQAPDNRHRPAKLEERDRRIYQKMEEARAKKKKLTSVVTTIAREEDMEVEAVKQAYRRRKLVEESQTTICSNDGGNQVTPPKRICERWIKKYGHRTSLSGLDRRLIAAWQHASLDLGIQVDCPFVVEHDRMKVRYAVHIHGFGATFGTVLRASPTGDLAPSERIPLAIMAEEEGCDFHIVSDLYCEYNKAAFIDFLNFSRWYGPSDERPAWHVDPPPSPK